MFEEIGVAVVPLFHCHFLLFLFYHQFLQDFEALLVLLLGLAIEMAQILFHSHFGNCLITCQFLLKKRPLMVAPLPDVLDLMLHVYLARKLPFMMSLVSTMESKSESPPAGKPSICSSEWSRVWFLRLRRPRTECGWNIFQNLYLNYIKHGHILILLC